MIFPSWRSLNQYMAYIREMQRQDLNVMSEFLRDGGHASGHQVQDAAARQR